MGEFACVLFKNEDLTEDMIDILRHFQTNLPTVTGDQLSFKRAVNSMHPVSSGHTAEDRLKGFTMQLGDWHRGFKILEVNNVCIKKCKYYYHSGYLTTKENVGDLISAKVMHDLS